MKYSVAVLIAVCGILATSSIFVHGNEPGRVGESSYSSGASIKLGILFKPYIFKIVVKFEGIVRQLIFTVVSEKAEVLVSDVVKTIDKLKNPILKTVLIAIPKLVKLNVAQIVNLLPVSLCEIPIDGKNFKSEFSKSISSKTSKILFSKLINFLGKYLAPILTQFFVDLLNDI